MTQTQYRKNIMKELQKLNESIDAKIMRGEKYSAESRRHKTLLKQVYQYRRPSLFGRLFATNF